MSDIQDTAHRQAGFLSSIVTMFVLALLCAPVLIYAQTSDSDIRDVVRAQLIAEGFNELLSEEEFEAALDDAVVNAREDGFTAAELEQSFLDDGLLDPNEMFYGGSGEMPAGSVACFDYYHFGSVQIPFSSQTESVVSGTPITFTGDIINENSYPIVDGSLYVKIFRLRDNPVEKNVNGPHVVDQFFVRSGIDLPANGSMPIAFSWDVPSYVTSGEYQAAAFFSTAQKFNLLGLPFTDDVVGNTSGFSVVGERSESIHFNKDDISINGEPFYFASFPPRISQSEPAEITARLVNETSDDVRVPVTWELYQWDAQRRENLVAQSEETVTIEAESTAPVSFTAADTQYPVYLLIGTMHWKNTRSVINVRFVREGTDRTRINFPAVDSFPLRKGEEATLFSCLHNSGTQDVVPSGELALRLLDERGREIHSYTYTGAVTGAMMGVADVFTPKTGYDNFTLEAQLYQSGEMVDSATLRYDCEEIDPDSCLLESEKRVTFDFTDPTFLPTLIILIVGTVVVIAVLVFVWRRLEDGGVGSSNVPQRGGQHDGTQPPSSQGG